MQRPRLFVLVDESVRRRCADFILREAPERGEVRVSPETMNQGQKDRFHAICSDLARSSLEWGGMRRTGAEWKVLLISGHAKATHSDAEIVVGLEGELVNVRESVTSMSKGRGASLIEYATAFAINNGVRLRGPAT